MICRFKLYIGSAVHECPNSCIKNLDEVAFTLERKDFSGVTRSFTSDFEFVGKVYQLVRSEYEDKGVLANVELSVETINNDWTYTEQFRCALDFSTIQIDSHTLTISSVDNSLSAKINSKKSTKYQFNVADLADNGLLTLERITMTNTTSLLIGSPMICTGGDAEVINLRVDGDEVFTKDYFEASNQIAMIHEEGEAQNSFFITCVKPGCDLTLDLKLTYKGYICARNMGASWDYLDTLPTLTLQVWKEDGESGSGWSVYNSQLCVLRQHSEFIHGILHDHFLGQYKTLALLQKEHPNAYKDDVAVVGAFDNPQDKGYWDSSALYEYNGEKWLLSPFQPSNYYKLYTITERVVIPSQSIYEGGHIGIRILSDVKNKVASIPVYGSHVVAKWTEPAQDSVQVNVIKPLPLIDAIVKKIDANASAEIVGASTLLDESYILAGEAIRQLDKAQVYSTFKDFAEWLSVQFGMTYQIEGKTVRFIPYEKLFTGEVVKTIALAKEVSYSVDDSLIYSEIQAGQEQKDYSEINGRDQWFNSTYDTGVSLTENKYQLMCKYRSDAYGIELCARKIGKNTTDSTSDESLFFAHLAKVDAESGGYSYSIAKRTTGGTTNKLFNSEYSAIHIIDANKLLIAPMLTPLTLKWTASSGNSSLLVDTNGDGFTDKSLKDDITITDRLFTAGLVEFKTSDVSVPTDWNGLVQVESRDRRYSGYIKSVSAKYSRIEALEYTLIVKSVEKI